MYESVSHGGNAVFPDVSETLRSFRGLKTFPLRQKS